MKIDTLAELTRVFVEWRKSKTNRGQKFPDELKSRAHRAVEVFGLQAVSRAINVPSIFVARFGGKALVATVPKCPVPGHSVVTLSVPQQLDEVIAEVVSPLGYTLRIFSAEGSHGIVAAFCQGRAS